MEQSQAGMLTILGRRINTVRMASGEPNEMPG